MSASTSEPIDSFDAGRLARRIRQVHLLQLDRRLTPVLYAGAVLLLLGLGSAGFVVTQ